MKKLSATMQGGAPAALVTKRDATLPDCREWSLDNVERYCEGLKKRMLAAVTEAMVGGLEEAHVRFAVQFDSSQKDPLAMHIELPGMNPGEDDWPPVRLKFSLKDAALGLTKPMGHRSPDEHSALRVRNALARLAETMTEEMARSP